MVTANIGMVNMGEHAGGGSHLVRPSIDGYTKKPGGGYDITWNMTMTVLPTVTATATIKPAKTKPASASVNT